MILQNWWYTTLLNDKNPLRPPLRKDIRTDIVIVGGGMAGISAALRLMGTGSKVVLLESNILGGSSTGKSAGFLTPDSELELSQLIRRYGQTGAKDLWSVPVRGIELILDSIQRFNISCDLVKQDSLFLGNGAGGLKDIDEEVSARKTLGFPSIRYSKEELINEIGSASYTGAVRYSGTFGVSALCYAQGIKNALLDHGVDIYESTEVMRIKDHAVFTHAGSVTAQEIIFCVDKPQPALTAYADNVYHAQTFLSVSEPLRNQEVKQLFPDQPFQCWDSDLVYTYFRLTGDQRLLVGGGSALTTFALHYVVSSRVIENVIQQFKKKFSFLKDLEFIQYWPGLIDTTRDLLPTILRDEREPWVHYVLGCVGLPWAAFCGDFVARHVMASGDCEDHHYYHYFTPKRNFLIPLWMERLLGKPLVFSLNNSWAKYYEVDDRGLHGDKVSP